MFGKNVFMLKMLIIINKKERVAKVNTDILSNIDPTEWVREQNRDLSGQTGERTSRAIERNSKQEKGFELFD